MYHMTLLCIAGQFWWYGINNETYFLFFRQTLQAWLVTKIGGGQPSAVPVRISVQSQDIQWVEMSALPTEPSLQPAQLYSYGVSAYDGDDLPLYV